MIATRNGTVKKTALSAYSRPQKGGIIAIKLDDDDQLIEVRTVEEGDDIVLSTKTGMSIRFSHEDARAMGRVTRGVRGIKLGADDEVVGMAIAEADKSLLTVCENGYGKRTQFGPGSAESDDETTDESASSEGGEEETASAYKGNMQYRRQKRGGKGLRDIRTSERNGPAMGALAVAEDDDILMVTSGGKIQRLRAADISQVGRNTQGVRIIRLSAGDKLVSVARIPADLNDEDASQPPAETAATEEEPKPANDATETDVAQDDTTTDGDSSAE